MLRKAMLAVAAFVAPVVFVACAPAQEVGPAADAPVQAASAVPGTTAQEAIDAAVEALGGAERIAAVRNITLMGYGQYAYQNGGGNITGLPGAPQKFIAANDLRRTYDLENGRYLQQERRNDLFPFAAYRGHSFALNRQGLDSDVAYNVNAQGAASRGGNARDRRMWMHMNPVVAVRAALDGVNALSNRRNEDGLTLVDVTLASGDLLTLAIRSPTNLPAWVRWSSPDQNLGEVVYTTHYYGFVPFDGVELPMGYTTKMDWRDVDYLKLYIDGYVVDSEIADLSAPPPADGALAAGAGGPGGVNVEVTPVARGVWRITGGTMVIEFADHMTLFEVGGGADRVRAVVAAAREIVPEKPVTEVIVSHHHFDHSRGLRQGVAEGLTVISRRDNGIIFEEMTSRPAPNFPDDLARNGQTLNFIAVDDSLVLEDDTMRVEIYHVIANNHLADGVLAYIPEHRMIIEADLATAAVDLQWWGDSWLDNIAYRNLDVDINVPVHMTVMSYDEVVEMVAPGIERVKEWCAEHEAMGNFIPGCPAFLR